MSELDFIAEDTLEFSKDKSICDDIKGEQIIFSEAAIKINRLGLQQSRNILITNTAFYNYKAKKLQRRIEILKIKGVTLSKQSNEFVLHGDETEYDYRYISPSSKKIVFILERCHEQLTGTELLFAYLDIPKLTNCVTNKGDRKKDPKFSRMNDSELSDIKIFIENECQSFLQDYYKNTYDIDDGDDVLRRFNRTSSKDKKNERFSLSGVNEPKFGRMSSITEGGKTRMSLMPSSFNDEDFVNDMVESVGNINSLNEDYIKTPQCTIDDFEFIRTIGIGKYTETYLAKYKYTGQYFAVKAAEKHIIIQNDFVENLINERRILSYRKAIMSNIYMPILKFSFQTDDRIFIVTDFYIGGDLYNLLSEKGKLNEKCVIFYAAQIVQALTDLHKNNVIFRNLKLENIVIDEQGYIKLIDFSKSKILLFDEDLSTSFNGNLDYFSPEILEGTGQTKATDWWSLGILIYELLFGFTPFHNDKLEVVFQGIINYEVKFPADVVISNDMKDLIQKLLIKKPEQRLGHKMDGTEIKNHPIFKFINFDELDNRTIQPPFKPKTKGKGDCVYFDKEITSHNIQFDKFIGGTDLEIIRQGNIEGLFKIFN